MIKIHMKKKRVLFVVLLVLLPLLLIVNPILQADSPIQIYSIDDLWNIRNDLSGYYILMNDLDFDNNDHYVDWTVSKNENTTGNGWLPIGNIINEFTGTFNGQNKNISNLFIDRDDDDGIGLFGYTLDSTIININLIDVDVTGYEFVGGLIGFNMGNISNCSITGTLNGDYYAGGLVGYNLASSISDSYAAVHVIGENCVGGLTGSNIDSSVNTSYAKGDITGLTDYDNNMGGLIGYNDGTIANCYANGNVTSEGQYSWYIGGLVGENDEGSSIANCYSTGYVDGSDVVGGLIGSNTGMVENCFWDKQTSGQDSSDGGTGKTTSEMKNFNTFNDAGWDIAKIEDYIDETWFINHTFDYPRLGWEPTSPLNNPPNAPSCLSPINHAINIPINVILNWSCTDPDGDPLTFDVYFGTSSNPPKVKSNQSETSYNPGTMNFNTKYYWKIVAWDNHGASTVSPIWDFTTKVNNPPNLPSNPDPSNHNTSVDINDELIWLGGDPDSGDTVTYDVYFGTTNTPPKVKSNQSGNTYNPGTMNFNTKYYWKIIAWDNHGFSTTGNLWDFTTTLYVNYPPDIPNNPTPNNKINININQDLYWDGGDLNSNDTVTYDIYFGTSNPLEFKEAIGPYPASQTSISYNPGTMNYNTKYYWRIIAWDNHGNSSTGPIWSFTTEDQPPDGGSGGGSPFIPPNKAPIADASASENSGFVNTPVKFNGSYSYDEDGEITNYTWDFGDNSYGYGIFTTHIYEKADVYNVKLTVTDDKGISDTDSFKVIISQPNNPPTIPQIDGPKTGKQNIEYNFTVFSTDADNDNIQYVFYWGDDQTTETDFLPNGTISIEKHKWTRAGIYKIRVVAIDSNYKSSASAEINILIDVLYCKNIGYFIDENSDETYDTFYSNTTGLLTDLIYQDGKYLIDTDGDGIEDYIYNIGTDALTKIKTPEEETLEYEDVILYILVLLVIVILIIIIIAKRPKHKAEEEKEKPKKTKPSTKKSKDQKKRKNNQKEEKR